jgi:hypothetical protein
MKKEEEELLDSRPSWTIPCSGEATEKSSFSSEKEKEKHVPPIHTLEATKITHSFILYPPLLKAFFFFLK